jgi:alanine-synthesizing transaminase
MFTRRTDWNLKPNRFTQAIEGLRATGTPLLDLTTSNPTTCGFHYEEDMLRLPPAPQYAPDFLGLKSARKAVCHYYAELPDPADVPIENIILTASTSEAYSFLFRLLCEPGEEILVAQPSYPLLEMLATIQDVAVKPYPLFYDHGWHIDIARLREAITPRTRAILIVHPNNPTGSFASEQEMSVLGEIAAERELALIADEVFLNYSFTSPRRSFASESRALTFSLSGLSKICGLPQMKLAWMVASGPDHLVRDAVSRLELIADTYLSVSTPVQLALPDLLATRHSFQQQLKPRLHANLAELSRQLAAQRTCSRLQVDGGWYATLRVPVTRSDEDLAVSLLEHDHVIVQPGHFFDFPNDGYLVLSLLTPEPEFTEGLTRILHRIERLT